MRKWKTMLCALLLPMALCACGSQSQAVRQAQAVAVTCPTPPAPPAWIMDPPGPSLTAELRTSFSVSPSAATAK
ncbi:membrane protein [Caballeronia zhejiangensis]|uniref:Membrane protein n=1 Tax=Caballeronia zhejiangensis TaxID=871203 RepID=A0A656Q9M4_9BURK|nr:membrane protein [Caballeronia zhejiangensis]